jgi:glycosyltransferase involved in cell wall biosynthesis
MRIALLAPTYWPEVTRGSERVVHDLAVLLAERGHDVTLLSSHRGPGSVSVEEGVRVVRDRRPPRVERLRFYEDHVEATPALFARLVAGRFDVAAAFHNASAWAAVRAHRFGGPPVAFCYHGLPTRFYLVERRYRIELMRAAIAGSAATAVLSEAAATAMRRWLQCEPRVLPAGIFTERFAIANGQKLAEPTLVCAASLGDPRKRAQLLFDAFARLRERLPDVRLQVVATRDPVLSGQPVKLPEGAELVDPDANGRGDGLPRVYATATASVLPAVGEAQGLVLLESLAAGTPAVAARSGAGPETLNSEQVGVLFEPDDEASLVEALEGGLKLAADPATAAACRTRAADFDWSRRIGAYEALLAEVAATGRAGRRGRRVSLRRA